jgi:ABC-2 type transport system permease protein
MKLHRIYAIILRVYYITLRNPDRAVEVLYFPILDLVLWGITSQYFTSLVPGGATYLVMILSGIVFWVIINRVQAEIPLNILEDLWNKNLINMFISPLSFPEWITGFIIWGILKSIISVSLAAVLALILYNVNVFSRGLLFVPLIFLLGLTGLWVGILISALIIRFGTRVQSAAWTLGFLIAPFSAVYYPVSILPIWARMIARIVPSSYVFEQMRHIIAKNSLDYQVLLVSFILNILYIILAVVLLRSAFKRRLNTGLLTLQS